MNTVALVDGVVVFTTSEDRISIPKGTVKVPWQGQDIGYLSPFLYLQKEWLAYHPKLLIWDVEDESRYIFRQEELQGFVQVNKLVQEQPMLTLLIPEPGGSRVRTTFHGGMSLEYRMRGLFLCFERYAMHSISGHTFPTYQPSFLDEIDS